MGLIPFFYNDHNFLMDNVILVIKVSLDRAANNLQNEGSVIDIN